MMQLNSDTSTPNPKRILIIEDEYFISELYSRALIRAGFAVDTRKDGRQGLAAAQMDEYDIILLDLMLPVLGGIEVLRTLKDSAKTPKMHAKIIIITNLDESDEIRAQLQEQADAYLVKAEVTPHDLVETVKQLVGA